MAAVDKIYIKKSQFDKLKRWHEMTLDQQEKDLGHKLPFDQYNVEERLEKETDNYEFPIWNLSVKDDMWLLSNCPFDFVKKNIMNNYNLE